MLLGDVDFALNHSTYTNVEQLLKIADLLEVDIKELIVREYKKFLVSQEMTKEARAEGKIACTMPCKEEEGDSQMIQNQISYGKE